MASIDEVATTIYKLTESINKIDKVMSETKVSKLINIHGIIIDIDSHLGTSVYDHLGEIKAQKQARLNLLLSQVNAIDLSQAID